MEHESQRQAKFLADMDALMAAVDPADIVRAGGGGGGGSSAAGASSSGGSPGQRGSAVPAPPRGTPGAVVREPGSPGSPLRRQGSLGSFAAGGSASFYGASALVPEPPEVSPSPPCPRASSAEPPGTPCAARVPEATGGLQGARLLFLGWKARFPGAAAAPLCHTSTTLSVVCHTSTLPRAEP